MRMLTFSYLTKNWFSHSQTTKCNVLRVIVQIQHKLFAQTKNNCLNKLNIPLETKINSKCRCFTLISIPNYVNITNINSHINKCANLNTEVVKLLKQKSLAIYETREFTYWRASKEQKNNENVETLDIHCSDNIQYDI